MKQLNTTVYDFNELTTEAKEHAIAEWYEAETYDDLGDILTELIKADLDEAGAEYDNIKVYYSLSCCQGDGLCFTGSITKDGKTLFLTHNYRYYFASSVEMVYQNQDGEEIGEVAELKNIYFATCRRAENAGYEEIEYRMSPEDFSYLCESNGYTFLHNGTMKNF